MPFFFNSLTLFLEAAGDGAASSVGFGLVQMLPFFLILIVFYFFMSRQDKKKKKKAEDMRNSLSLGDEIITIGGMIGKVVQVTEDTITFETGEDRVRVQIKKWAVSTTAKMEAEEAKKK
jgi:preprotein translocase subunit YajC